MFWSQNLNLEKFSESKINDLDSLSYVRSNHSSEFEPFILDFDIFFLVQIFGAVMLLYILNIFLKDAISIDKFPKNKFQIFKFF